MPELRIIVSTYSKNERYLDLCIEILRQNWQQHPDVVVFSDEGAFTYQRRVLSGDVTWVGMMSECLRKSIREGLIGEDDQVILLLEDHVPHGAVDGKLIDALGKYLRRLGNTYLNLCAHGVADQCGSEVGCSVHAMHLHTYSSLHPAIWSVGHLQRSFRAARETGAESPWQFERLRLPSSLHYTTGISVWPSPHGGFLWRGVVNRPALSTMKAGALKALRRRLLVRLVGEMPGRLFRRVFFGSAA